MKKTLFLVALALVAATLANAQAKIDIIGGTKLDFGDIPKGKKVEKTVSVKNEGKDTLVLGRVEVSCGCTGTVVTNDHIPPGGTGSLLITFNSQNFAGTIHKSVTVNSNSVDEPKKVIEFTGNVIEELTLTPSQFWFRDAETGKRSTVAILVRNKGKERLSLTGYKTTLEGFTLKLPENPIEQGDTALITAEFTPKTVRQVLSDGVFLKTSSPTQPEVYIQIYGTVKEFKFQ